MKQFVCIHGHFYQPPRENPWLEEIELQDSAFPFHDWNERITEECYGPNATARILNGDGRIEQIVNNYARISFNFGPTLLSWMEKAQKEIYGAIVQADHESRKRFSGHGSAMAQVYNHMILPLATPRDMRTQVLWGIRDFERRFGRSPKGMWLAETAANTGTLEALAEHGIEFTVLSPYQARRFRKLGARAWRDARGAKIDPRRPYRQFLPSGRSIDLFFYDGPVSQAVAFEGLLTRGEHLARRLMDTFDEDSEDPQLVHIATDGETYGHHHRHGDMALAYALQYIEDNELATLTNYSEYLEKFPPEYEVQIEEDTSWSCAHGIERWRSDCGCCTGGNPEWNQKWRKPLRDALDWLRDELSPLYETEAKKYLRNPWDARDDFIDIILDRSMDSWTRFLERHAPRMLSAEEWIRVAKLLEMQRHAMLMYTSCGWFFDELSGIETVQVIGYAGRAVQLAQELFGDSIEERFLERLSEAKSNIPEHGDGRRIYEKFVRPAFIDLNRVGAHYIITSLFHPPKKRRERIHCYRVEQHDQQVFETGRNKMVVGHAHFQSIITREAATLSFGAVYFAHHTVNAGVRAFQGDAEYAKLLEEASTTFESADYPKIIRTFDKHFGDSSYSLYSMFRDQQQEVLDRILASTLSDIETHYRHIYEDQAPLLRFLHGLGARIPTPLQMTAEFVLNARLRNLLGTDELDHERIRHTLEEVREAGITLHEGELQRVYQVVMERKAGAVEDEPTALDRMEDLLKAAEVYRDLPFDVNVRRVQNTVYYLIDPVYREMESRASGGEELAAKWTGQFRSVTDLLYIRLH